MPPFAFPTAAILFTDGAGGSGPLASTEFFNTDGSASAGAAMQQPRTGHAAVLRQDGRVLVAGGVTTKTAITSSAELYEFVPTHRPPSRTE